MSAPVGRPRAITRYVWRSFAVAFTVALGTVFALYLVLDGANQYGSAVRAGRHDVVMYLLRYYALQLPMIFVQVGPVVTLIGAAFALTKLRRDGELLPIFASGVSLQRVLWPVLGAAVVLSGTTLALEQWVTPEAAASQRSEGLSTRRDAQIFGLLVEDRSNHHVVFCGKYTPARQLLENVHVFEMAPDDAPGTWRIRRRLFAWEGEYGDAGWVFRRGYHARYDAQGDRHDFTTFEEHPWPALKLLPYDLEHGAALGVALEGATGGGARASLDTLWRATRDPEAPAAPRVHLHARIAHALAHLALLLAGLPLVMRRESRSLVIGALLAGAVCGAYFLLQALCFDLGVRGLIPPALAGWAPVAILGAIGCTWFDALPT